MEISLQSSYLLKNNDIFITPPVNFDLDAPLREMKPIADFLWDENKDVIIQKLSLL